MEMSCPQCGNTKLGYFLHYHGCHCSKCNYSFRVSFALEVQRLIAAGFLMRTDQQSSVK